MAGILALKGRVLFLSDGTIEVAEVVDPSAYTPGETTPSEPGKQ
jgi:hypothetical protein